MVYTVLIEYNGDAWSIMLLPHHKIPESVMKNMFGHQVEYKNKLFHSKVTILFSKVVLLLDVL